MSRNWNDKRRSASLIAAVSDWNTWVSRLRMPQPADNNPKTIEVRYTENGQVLRTRTVPMNIKFGDNHGRA